MRIMSSDDFYSRKIEFWEWEWLRGDIGNEQTALAYILYYYECYLQFKCREKCLKTKHQALNHYT